MTKAELLKELESYPDDARIVVAVPSGDDVEEVDYVAPYPSDAHGAEHNETGLIGTESRSDIVIWPKWQ